MKISLILLLLFCIVNATKYKHKKKHKNNWTYKKYCDRCLNICTTNSPSSSPTRSPTESPLEYYYYEEEEEEEKDYWDGDKQDGERCNWSTDCESRKCVKNEVDGWRYCVGPFRRLFVINDD
jgi:hypothetical protein